MTRTELIGAVARKQGITIREASIAVRGVFEGIEEGLGLGMRVELRGFGTWRARLYPGYRGIDPRTGKPIEVAAKVLPAFRASKALLRRIRWSPNPEK